MPEDNGGQKVGGINKNWWYVIGAVAGIMGYLWYRNYKNNQNATNSLLSNTPLPFGSSAGNSTTSLAPPTSATGNTLSTLNDWMHQAQSWAVTSLGKDPATVQNALQNYSNGNCLTATEFDIVDRALGNLGQPPDAPFQGVVRCAGSTTTPTPIPTTTGFGTKVINGVSYTLLGILTGNNPAQYEGYQVSGGAPVFYLAPGQSNPEQGTKQAIASAQVLVPSIYNPFVSSKTAPLPSLRVHAT